MDLVIVLANCLDNAIEAVEKLEQAEQRKIRVVMLNDEGGISILVENPVVDRPGISKMRYGSSYHGIVCSLPGRG
mgnify:CR=1 FL=1